MASEQPNSGSIAHSNQLIQQGKYKDAQVILSAFLDQNPTDPQALELLCYSCIQDKDYSKAEMWLQKAIEMQDNNPKLFYNLGFSLRNLNKIPEAIDAYQKALTLDPNFQDAHINLGNLYTTQNQSEKAIESYTNALKINPNNPLIHYNLGHQYEILNQVDNAIKSYQNVLALEPQAVAAIYNLAQIFIKTDNKSKALVLIENGLKHKNDFAPLHRLLSLCHHYTDPNHAHIQSILSLLKESGLLDEDKIHLFFALGKIHDDLQNRNEAFEYYKKGHALQAEQDPFNLSEHLKFTKELITASPVSYAFKASSLTPIFILGMPLSGKSLLERILASHQSIQATGNLSIEPYLHQPNIFQRIVTQLETEHKMFTLTGFSNVYYLNHLMLLFPKAKIIYCKRGHMDTCLSEYFHYFPNNAGQTHDLKNLALFHRDFDLMMIHWRKKYNDALHSIQYEDLVQKTDDTLKSVCEFLSIQQHDLKPVALNTDHIGRWKPYREHLLDLEIVFKLNPTQLKSMLNIDNLT